MKITVNYADGVLNLPRAAARNMKTATREDLAALIAALAEPAALVDLDSSADKIAEDAGLSRGQLMSSLAFWRGAGVIGIEGAPVSETADEAPKTGGRAVRRPAEIFAELSADDIERIMTSSPERRSLLNECQQTIGHMFNNTEAAIVLGMRENLGVDDEYILLLTSFCVKRGKATVKYVEKTALSLYEKDIDTTEALEDYLSWLEASESIEGRLRTLFGTGQRSFTKKERGYLERWEREYGYGYEMIEAAYNVTVDAIGKLSMPYMDRVIGSWHEKGYKTPDDVSAGEGKRKQSDAGANGNGSFDTDDFFRLAVARGAALGGGSGKKSENGE